MVRGTDLEPISKKQEATQGTQEDSEGRSTEADKKSSVRTDLKSTSKKQESTQGTQEDSEGRLTEADKKSSAVSKEASKSESRKKRKKKSRAKKTKDSETSTTTKSMDTTGQQEASQKTLPQKQRSPELTPFSEPIPEEDLDVYKCPASPTKSKVSQQRKLNAALSSLFNTNTLRSQSISDARSGLWSLDDRKFEEPKPRGKPSKKGPFGRTRFSKSGKRRKFVMQSDDLITPSCTVKLTSVTAFQIN
ncbi:hypothetical protein Y032_0124g1200 [Ancylostoma ceylanicum]|uniref:Uncharacterized protein n=1 Tax=Ancylostoma ceylanicum TaxID=53326 RepID=A0A016T985_9BILA|nr:hypothetical protein Y032_0124g1200 [Ancylostoma ceylanicum]